VLSVPFSVCYLFATKPRVMSQVLVIGHRVTRTYLVTRARMTVKSGAQNRAVTLIQSFRSALNFNLHVHLLGLTGDFTPEQFFAGRYQRLAIDEQQALYEPYTLNPVRFVQAWPIVTMPPLSVAINPSVQNEAGSIIDNRVNFPTLPAAGQVSVGRLVWKIDIFITRFVELAAVLVDHLGQVEDAGTYRFCLFCVVRDEERLKLYHLVRHGAGQVVLLGGVCCQIKQPAVVWSESGQRDSASNLNAGPTAGGPGARTVSRGECLDRHL
jgi:hypothetical protein